MNDVLKKLNVMHERSAILLEQLARSLAVQEICPEAFANGACSTRVRGNPQFKPDEAMWIVTDGEGKEYLYKLMDIPMPLWPEYAVVEFNKSRRNQARNMT